MGVSIGVQALASQVLARERKSAGAARRRCTRCDVPSIREQVRLRQDLERRQALRRDPERAPPDLRFDVLRPGAGVGGDRHTVKQQVADLAVEFFAAKLDRAASGSVGGTVPATLLLTLGPAPSFGVFTPDVSRTYAATGMANVISTAGDAAPSVSDPSSLAPGRLVNGVLSLASPLLVGGSPMPAAVKSWASPVSNDPVHIAFSRSIGANEALRAGTHAKTLTFTLSTTQP